MKHYTGNPQTVMEEMITYGRTLTIKSNEYSQLCAEFAEKERVYNIALVSEMVKLKGPPENLASTACERRAKGDPHIAGLRYERDVSKGVMNACDKAMQNLRTVLNAHQSILAWERKTAEL